ncbi:MAG TPA: acetate/propionate family kinase [Geminicoccaceae bacterium]|nr:acetate/propionate family kinase [Geminicoccus sp.]HMU52756.1 acetate/propionate family kinase [Geminicoccaceae bacterium]
MADHVLVINAGSSSIKFELFAVDAGDALRSTLSGQLDGIGTHPHLKAEDAGDELLVDHDLTAEEAADVQGAMQPLGTWLRGRLDGAALLAVGHRVVHGGAAHSAPVRVDAGIVAELRKLVPLAPLHQPNNLAPIEAIAATRPDLPQIACFDTAFHRSHPEVADRFAIPEAFYQEGVRRYGFHGLSYEYIAGVLPERLAQGRTVVAHLGSGASMCAVLAGRSVDSTMGFTALDGLPMGTRTGQIDPGVLLYLMQTKSWDAARLERFLYHESGLKGLSGISNDMRDLLASDAPSAKLAVDYFVYRITRETGSLAAAMGGIDGLVFTAGIGEHSPAIRERVCRNLAWMGLELDEAANAAGGPLISTAGSRVEARIIPTDEELMIARHSLATLRKAEGAAR